VMYNILHGSWPQDESAWSYAGYRWLDRAFDLCSIENKKNRATLTYTGKAYFKWTVQPLDVAFT
jgi:hypothetical protein